MASKRMRRVRGIVSQAQTTLAGCRSGSSFDESERIRMTRAAVALRLAVSELERIIGESLPEWCEQCGSEFWAECSCDPTEVN